MSTTLFPVTTAVPTVPAWPDGNYAWASATKKAMTLARGSGVASVVDATAATIATDLTSSVPGTVYTQPGANGAKGSYVVGAGALVFVSPAVNGFTLAGAVTVNARALESATTANYGIGAALFWTPSLASADVPSDPIGVGFNITELGTTEAARSISITPSSTAIPDGGYIVLVFQWVGIGASASGRTATFFYNGTASAASGDAFVTFTENITFVTGPLPRSSPYPQILAH